MGDSQRFWRYAVPGAIFGVQVLVVIWVMAPTAISTLRADFGLLNTVAGALLTSPILGILLAHIHHLLTRVPRYAKFRPDHRPALERLRSGGRLKVIAIDEQGHECAVQEPIGSLDQAWLILTCLWHERLETNDRLKGASKRTDSLTDIMQGLCALHVGAWFLAGGSLFGVIILAIKLGGWHIDLITPIVVVVLAIVLVWVHREAAKRIVRQFELFVDVVLTDALHHKENGNRDLPPAIIRFPIP